MTHSEEARTRVAATWSARARSELEAAERFSRVGHELAEIGATEGVAQGILEAAEDERRHAGLCTRIAEQFGAAPGPPEPVRRERAGRPDLDLRDCLLWEMVSACCVGETMNVALLSTLRERTTESTVREAVRELLRDEVRHSRLGWAHLAQERAAGRGAFLQRVLPLILEASVEPGFFAASSDACSRELQALGEMSAGESASLYRETLRTVVFPGFESMGLDPERGRTWLDHRVLAG